MLQPAPADSLDNSYVTSATQSRAFSQSATPQPVYDMRTQSIRLHNDNSTINAVDINRLLERDLTGRITQVSENLAESLFPDEAFGFAINNQFLANFDGSFISAGGFLTPSNFSDESHTALFLNRMISTITLALHAMGQTSITPLRYFTAIHSNKPLSGAPIKRMPDIMLVRLLDGCTQARPFYWRDVQALIEHTREKKPPERMAETVTVKSYLTFCAQPERDFVISLCITSKGFHIIVTDHVGQIEADIIPFDHSFSTQVFFRMIMGLAFLPDGKIGVDTTMVRRECGRHNSLKFAEFIPFPLTKSGPGSLSVFAKPSPHFNLQHPLSIT
jgi:hypothetical protein